MWWLAAPILGAVAKVVYDVVTDDDSSSYTSSSSNYDEQKRRAEEKERKVQVQKAKIQRKSRLISQFSKGTDHELKSIQDQFLNCEPIFKVNNIDKLKMFACFPVSDELSALEAVSLLSKNNVKAKVKASSNNINEMSKEIKELTELELILLDELK